MNGRRPPRLTIGAMAAAFAALLTAAGAGEIPSGERRPGSAFTGAETRAMEADDGLNPGMLWVAEGEALWSAPAGATGKACADCHGDTARSMAGVAARHPAFDAARGGPITLAGRIERCRRDRQGVPTPAPRAGSTPPADDPAVLALSAFVTRQSRGLPVTTGDDPRLAGAIEAGRRLYEARMGQLNLACAHCHDANWGRTLGGAMIPQGHPTGYPVYRLEWQSLGSLERRLRNCLVGMRAEPFAPGGPEYVALELYLMTRARGMAMEAPGVRP